MGSEAAHTWVVTGSSRGLGLGLVTQLLESGEAVVATARNPAKAPQLQALADKYASQLTLVALDTADAASIKAAAAEVAKHCPGGIDVLINNAGITGDMGPARDETAEAITEVYTTNVLGPFLTMQAFLPLLQKGRKKQIVNISSGLGSVQGMKDAIGGEREGLMKKLSLAYKMSKSALNMQTVALAMDLKPDGFTVICMCPGWVATDMGSAAADDMTGVKPDLDVQTSVAGQLKVIRGLTPELTASYYSYNGKMNPF